MKQKNEFSFRWATGAALGAASLLAACSGEMGSVEAGDGLPLWTVEDGTSGVAAESHALAADDVTSDADEGTPGEGVDGTVEKAGCVHIQFCNEPGTVGTVCIWDACSFAAALAECTDDANLVCGGITQPAVIR